MRRMSNRRAAEHRKRVAYLRAIDADQNVCEKCHAARANDCHELLSRARGGSITDPSNLAFLCRRCHDWITQNPDEAEGLGWALARVEAS